MAMLRVHDDRQRAIAQDLIRELEAEKIWPSPVVTELLPAAEFYKAEDYHQEYYAKNSRQPYCRVVIEPKIAKLREHYQEKLRQ